MLLVEEIFLLEDLLVIFFVVIIGNGFLGICFFYMLLGYRLYLLLEVIYLNIILNSKLEEVRYFFIVD